MAATLNVDTIKNSAGTGAPSFANGLTTTKAATIDGSADEVQLTVQGNATQTSNILVVEKSDGTDILQVSNAGVLKPLQPAFFARNTGSQSVTSGVEATVTFGTEDFDVAGNFASNTFTAPIAGKYMFTAQVYASCTGSFSDTRMRLSRGGASTYDHTADFGSRTAPHTMVMSVILNMAVNDTLSVKVTLTGTSPSVIGDATARLSYFSGYFLG